MVIRKGYRYRIYPNSTQRSKLAVQFGHSRFVYNHYLHLRNTTYQETGKSLNYNATARRLTKLKATPEFAWLGEADSQVLQQSLMDLQRAFDNFFRRFREGKLPPGNGRPRKDGRPKGYPRFKSKRDKQSIRYPQRFHFNDAGDRIYLPKVGWVRVVVHRPVEGKMKSCTVSKTKTGKYFISIQCEVEIPDPAVRVEPQVGIDLGLIDFITTSDGHKVPTPKYLRRAERRLRIRQRRLSRKDKGSKNREKARQRVALQHEKVANQRRDFHHQQSHWLTAVYGRAIFEGLNIAGMVRNHRLAKSIVDAGWGQFVRFCEYKATWTGGTVEKADRFFPSTKTCSACGEEADHLTLSARTWVCLNCGALHDRDENAAINLLQYRTAGAAETYASGDTIPVGGSAQEAQWL